MDEKEGAAFAWRNPPDQASEPDDVKHHQQSRVRRAGSTRTRLGKAILTAPSTNCGTVHFDPTLALVPSLDFRDWIKTKNSDPVFLPFSTLVNCQILDDR